MKRVLFVAFTTALPLLFGCEKDIYDTMEGYYVESQNLQSVTIDSVTLFSQKVDKYVTQFPKEKEHHLYPKIRANIKSASLRINIKVDTTWAGEKHINF